MLGKSTFYVIETHLVTLIYLAPNKEVSGLKIDFINKFQSECECGNFHIFTTIYFTRTSKRPSTINSFHFETYELILYKNSDKF